MDWRKDCHPGKWLPIISWLFLYLLACCDPKKEKEAPLDEALTASNQVLIVGDWYPVDSLPFNLTGYCFMTDNLCRNHLGFYEYIDPANGAVLSRPDTWNIYPDSSRQASGYAWLDNVIRCYGHQTVYEIRNDRLNIFDPARQDWVEQRMEFPSADTLVLINSTDSVRETYIRKIYPVIDDQPVADEMIFYYPGSRYTEEDAFFSVKHPGLLYNKGFRRSILRLGIIDKEEYQRNVFWFSQAARITPLTDLRDTNRHDRQTIDKQTAGIAFVTDGKINLLEDPVGLVPLSNREFYWAYFASFFIYDYAHLIPYNWVYESDAFERPRWPLYDSADLMFEKKDSTRIRLNPFEIFYLNTLLDFAEPADQYYLPKYELKGIFYTFDGEIGNIKTDGRYFTYTVGGYDGSYTKTFDIGFNFIKVNGLDRNRIDKR